MFRCQRRGQAKVQQIGGEVLGRAIRCTRVDKVSVPTQKLYLAQHGTGSRQTDSKDKTSRVGVISLQAGRDTILSLWRQVQGRKGGQAVRLRQGREQRLPQAIGPECG